MNTLQLDDILGAAERLRGQVVDTPCLHSRTLSTLCGCEVFLKFENHQFTASFKERGALNKMAQLTADERARNKAGAPHGLSDCPHCGATKCCICDLGDDVECGNCDPGEDE